MEWLTDALVQYIFIIGGSIAGIIARLTREPLSAKNTARAIGALAITTPAAAEIIALADLWDRPHSQVLVAAILALAGDRIVGSVQERVAQWDWLRAVAPPQMPIPPMPEPTDSLPPEMRAVLDRLDALEHKDDDR